MQNEELPAIEVQRKRIKPNSPDLQEVSPATPLYFPPPSAAGQTSKWSAEEKSKFMSMHKKMAGIELSEPSEVGVAHGFSEPNIQMIADLLSSDADPVPFI
jgi:hypothetical protein